MKLSESKLRRMVRSEISHALTEDVDLPDDMLAAYESIRDHIDNIPDVPIRRFRELGAGDQAKQIDDLYWQLEASLLEFETALQEGGGVEGEEGEVEVEAE